jgi:hypothetical protein
MQSRKWISLVLAIAALGVLAVPMAAQAGPRRDLRVMMNNINRVLAGQGASLRIRKAEYIGTSDQMGNTIIAKNTGNKRLDSDFVPGDPRRPWGGAGGNAITYAIDTTGDAVPPFGGLGAADTDAAIVRAHESWEALNCSHLGQSRNPDFGEDIGWVANFFGLGGTPFVFADVQHAGFTDIDFGGNVLGVTFTLIWVDADTGEPTDIDNNGRQDTAFREIYYDPGWNWADDGVTNIDLESVAVHEIGHGLSQAHFGKVFVDNNGNLKFAPKAVMNAVYAAPQRSLLATDKAGHCANWGSWPNN